MKVHEALSDYTDRLNAGQKPKVEEYEGKLKPKDYKEFAQLAPLVNTLKGLAESGSWPDRKD